YLTLTGDAATIAGSSLEEMGSIFNKVQTSGKAYTDNLNQLADRGIPIFQWLQDEYGVTAEELSKMVKEGKVDAETFNKVIQENIGGAALESGKTLRGSFANMKAALGRAGAAVIEPFLPMMKAGLGKVMEFTDKVTPHLKAGAEKAAAGLTDMGRAFMSSGDSIEGPATKMERFGVKAREVVDGIKGVWSILSKGEFAGSKMTFGFEEDSKTVEILFKIREGAQALWDVVKSPSGEKFTTFLETVKGTGGEAANSMGKVESGANTLTGALKSIGSAAAGGATALVSLGGDTATVAVAGIKALGSVMGYFADHTGLATAALAGLAAAFAISQTAQTAFHLSR
ncbi:tape measure protein, partial [Kitasatospora sp. NPDC058184]